MLSIVELAPAKLNLYLHVLGRRSDGLHLLDSLIIFVDCVDCVTVECGDVFDLVIEGPFAAVLRQERLQQNLIYRAARKLADRIGKKLTTRFHLYKALPVSAGIGGGSTDAAACLRALARLWGMSLDEPLLYDVAQEVGCDVPACLYGRSCFVGGIGEQITPTPDLPSCFFVLVHPGVALPTADVFQAFSTETTLFSQSGRFFHSPETQEELVSLLSRRQNNLTEAALKLLPLLHNVFDALERSEGCLLTRLSGSGATCFGLYDSQKSVQNAVLSLKREHPSWWVKEASLQSIKEEVF